ncbi:acyl-CoA thioesterase [Allofranklinella schreckenbergeri]|uniref:Acyl-CoA thioesterase n=1 Tax=Allofranklinella schreckenbergeri TaxID=1076744 RepID=A0A3M6R9L4_9BURK|nr:acyl-CoA thioesterase [Allofranklinella schreckenbergeri]RMW99773.1 acyl-CoA thioesterase [Allofranklinella schreckenbergeri]RMX11569.1 acyl-CoA thioesterase [Allofranklinella schreckenbergeri]RRD41490.1 acyl-CoA thioesterase [Comamonadaceae bacterium OH3737_COT-264]
MTSFDSATEVQEIVLAQDANHRQTLFAGHGLRMLAKSAYLCARQFAHNEVVMARVVDVQFLAPVAVGSALSLRAWVARVGRSSMTVCVHGLAEQAPGIPAELALQGLFEMVAVDAHGRPKAVPQAVNPNQEKTP